MQSYLLCYTVGLSSELIEASLLERWFFLNASTHFLSSRVFADKEAMMAGALEMAGEIAGRSPVAVQGTKINLIYSRDHSVAEGLDYMVRTSTFLLNKKSHHEAAF